MRICHVSPHLPPDQAANALLPAQLGVWSAARGDDSRVRHRAALAGPASGRGVTGTRRTRARALDVAAQPPPARRCASARSLDRRGTRPRRGKRGPAPPPQQRTHHRGGGGVGGAAADPIRADALRHGDLALPAAVAARSFYACLPSRPRGHLLQPGPARSRAGTGPHARPAFGGLSGCLNRLRPRGRTHTRYVARRARHSRTPRHPERQASAPAGWSTFSRRRLRPHRARPRRSCGW